MPKKRGPKLAPNVGPLMRKTVTLDESTVRKALVFGANLSDGLRKAVGVAYRAYQKDGK